MSTLFMQQNMKVNAPFVVAGLKIFLRIVSISNTAYNGYLVDYDWNPKVCDIGAVLNIDGRALSQQLEYYVHVSDGKGNWYLESELELVFSV